VVGAKVAEAAVDLSTEQQRTNFFYFYLHVPCLPSSSIITTSHGRYQAGSTTTAKMTKCHQHVPPLNPTLSRIADMTYPRPLPLPPSAQHAQENLKT